MERAVVFRMEILGVDAFQKVFQLAHVQLDNGRIGEDHDSVPRRPAKSPRGLLVKAAATFPPPPDSVGTDHTQIRRNQEDQFA